MQFRKDKLYHFKGSKWNQTAHREIAYEMVIIGSLVRTYCDPSQREIDCRGEWKPDGRTYRIDDGHLPEHQPRVSANELGAFMGPQAIRFAYPID